MNNSFDNNHSNEQLILLTTPTHQLTIITTTTRLHPSIEHLSNPLRSRQHTTTLLSSNWRYKQVSHIACTTLATLITTHTLGTLITTHSLNQLALNCLSYIPWIYLLYQYKSSYPQLDPHSIYRQAPKSLITIQIDHKTFLSALCLLITTLFITIHLFFTNLPFMLLADTVFLLLTYRSVFQTMLEQKQINRRLEQMQNSRLYVIESFTFEQMKQPFEMEQMESLALIRNSSLNHLVPQFMHSFYKPRKLLRMQSQVQHFD